MDLDRLYRIPKRVRQDLKIIGLASNWRDILAAKSARLPIRTIKLRNGVVMKAPEQVALDFLFHEIWIDEFYAPAGYEIQAGNVVIDIGANIGVFALYAATHAPDVKVRSFEPFPENARYFSENQAASNANNVQFEPKAVAGRPGRRVLHVEDSWILHSLTDQDSTQAGLEVECVTLDQILSDLPVCNLLKMDCEGGEYEILYSASEESLSKISRIVCEFNLIDDKQKNGSALQQFLTSKGFIVDSMKVLDSNSGFLCARKS